MPQLKSEGIILRSVNWKEHSRIVTFFTDNAGKLAIVDRGGRSIKSKRGRLLSFSRLEITYFKSERTGTGYIGEVEPLESFSLERDGSLGRLTFASAALEILNDLLPESEPQEDLYHLTVTFLRHIDIDPKGALLAVFLAYFIKLLSYMGYRPNLAGCVTCGRERGEIAGDHQAALAFSPERGGLVCHACQTAGEYYIRVQPDQLDTLYSLQTSSLSEAAGVQLTMRKGEELLEILTTFMKYQTGTGELKSLKFLEKLKRTQLT
ncbi:MAG: DNA repair protein RecO [Candidatus Zixiibacteriota bacterium]|nr:MAG: DNA repair protein RecO [candidate division Zixibacteria bacterium]